MGTPGPPESAILFVATLYPEDQIFSVARSILIKEFGDLLYESEQLPWNYSDYYRNELGWPLFRRFLSFKKIINPELIKDIKLITNGIEERLSINERRSINLDPGYLTMSKVVLATTKNYAHRIYLGKGIYAEVTLMYRGKGYMPHDFTYRDYRSSDYARFFQRVRGYLKNTADL
jgi:hypothetical protein